MSRPAPAPLHLAFDLPAEILYDDAGLARVDQTFVAWLAGSDPNLTERLLAGRRQPETLDDKAHSELLVALAPHLEDFLGTLFGIGAEVGARPARRPPRAPRVPRVV
jgi:hypothetical protein